MATKISVLFGEVITDNAIQRSAPMPAGIYEMGTPTISSGTTGPWTPTLNVGGDLSRIVWREVGSASQGRAVIQESAAISISNGISAADATRPRIDLIVGCHQWVDGAALASCWDSGTAGVGKPNGYLDPSMMPYYRVVTGTPSAGLVAPTAPDCAIGAGGVPSLASSYSGPSGTGGAPVPLAWVFVPPAGAAPTIGLWPASDLRWSTLYALLYAPDPAPPAISIPAGGLPWVDSVTGHTYNLTLVSGVLTLTY